MAVQRCIAEGRFCVIAKSDLKLAFRHVCMRIDNFRWLIMKCECPWNGQVYFFVDKCLPFGSSISCKIFQDFSDALAHLVQYRTKKILVNYLDDYLFIQMWRRNCNQQVKTFLAICNKIRFPVSLEKTVWASHIMTFLGLLLNTITQTVSIPVEKIDRAKKLLTLLLGKKKVTVLEMQKMVGFLNFLCRAIIPGRASTRRFYMEFSPEMKPHYHIRLTQELKDDMHMWLNFLNEPSIFCRPFLDFNDTMVADKINMYSDASGVIGFGAFCENDWLAGLWNADFLNRCKPSIEFLELFVLVAGVLCWIRRFKNRRVILFTDNHTVQTWVNECTASDKNSLHLIRLMVLECVKQNVILFAEYVELEANTLADSLSRDQMVQFWDHAPETMNHTPTDLPLAIWPIEKFWKSS